MQNPHPHPFPLNGRWDRKEPFFVVWNRATQIQNKTVPNVVENPLNYNVSTYSITCQQKA